MSKPHGAPLAAVGLFAGIGGLELGMRRAGHEALVLAENYPPASRVLTRRFRDAEIRGDVREIASLPSETSLLLAGFPCQDFSSVGLKSGINGVKSSIVAEIFRLLRVRRVRWVVLENVPFLLKLHRGMAMSYIVSELERLGYRWAYRVIDSEAFGVPQRRRRLYLAACIDSDPRPALFDGDVTRPDPSTHSGVACGFYWTEGMRALGWAVDAVPPIKGGSSIGVPSPPAILFPSGLVATPDIRDAERLQGFPANWTLPAQEVTRSGFRWQLVGNAVTVNVAKWLGQRLVSDDSYDANADEPLAPGDPYPSAAWGEPGLTPRRVNVGSWPCWVNRRHLEQFLLYAPRPLSVQAVQGFLKRTRKGSLRFPKGFLENLEVYTRKLAA